MNIHNATKMVAGTTMGLDPDGRERVVAIVKGTFDFPTGTDELALADQQAPLVAADQFLGQPGLSAVAVESDFAPGKPTCDVLFVGAAYAPHRRPAPRVRVSLAVTGLMEKTFDVCGARIWTRVLGSAVASNPPRNFERLPIHYGVAFGGMDQHPARPDDVDVYYPNPVGVGYYPLSAGKALEGKPLASTCAAGEDVKAVKGSFRPLALGPLGRNFAERVKLAGTYDQRWLDDVFPFLPRDFQPAYLQAAPPDQQIRFPRGGEEIVLTNLTGEGRTVFTLPRLEMPALFSRSRLGDVRMAMNLDTIAVDGEARKVCLTWRTSLPLKRNMFEVQTVVVGHPSAGWLRARATGKEYYASIGALARSRLVEPEPADDESDSDSQRDSDSDGQPTPMEGG